MVSLNMNEWNEFVQMDKSSLLSLVAEKDRRIQDLERLVEDQKRLRLQDSNQVEEKAAKIKEWVTNKLKELENQNRQLREQNRKQKEAVESLTNKLASLSPVSSPRRRASNLDKLQYIEHTSPVNTIDVDKSLKCRRPQLKKSCRVIGVPSASDDERSNLVTPRVPRMKSDFQKPDHDRVSQCRQDVMGTFIDPTGKSIVSIGSSKPPVALENPRARQDSPLYDSVNAEQNNSVRPEEPVHYGNLPADLPPPLPPHQSNKWEMHLYNLVDQTLSSLKEQQQIASPLRQMRDQRANFESFDDHVDTEASRKSSTSSKNDFDTLVHPTFTTIDGDQVVENFNSENSADNETDSMNYESTNSRSDFAHRRASNDQTSQSSNQLNKIRRDSLTNSHEQIDMNSGQNLFNSPMRSRAGRDNILRTQSVRKNPAPERLHDFITADLVKRGYLVKTGALKNHNRWFVLKNFQLCSFKRESDETAKAQSNLTVKLDTSCHVHLMNQSSEGYPFKLSYQDKNIQLIAESAQTRDEWMRILTVSINMSDIDPIALTKHNSTYESVISVTRHGHTKRCHAVLVSHIVFFLKSCTDPTPLSYISVKGSKIREITDTNDYDIQEHLRLKDTDLQDCSLAIYPKFSLDLDPVYMSLGSQQETDAWLCFLSQASGIDQSHGTQFERTLARTMINNSMLTRRDSQDAGAESNGRCLWREQSVMMYSDRSISQPLTSLPNETLQMEALEMSRSILLFTQVPQEPVAIDYHVCLLQNCLGKFLKNPELRNEFYAQLIKQSTYVHHRCSSPKLSSSSSGCSSLNPRSSDNSLSPSSSECQFVTKPHQLQSIINEPDDDEYDTNPALSQLNSLQNRRDSSTEYIRPPAVHELLQVMQILAVAVSLNLPRGRIRWWLIDHLRKFASSDSDIGKYAMYTLRAIDRTIANGTRDFVPSRTEIMSILLRNPQDHSKPHSLPVSFADGSYLVVETDGSTTVEEFMATMSKSINIRHSSVSDFYLFASDPSGLKDLHILEPQRKIFDVVGWWEQTFKQKNSGRFQHNKVIKMICKKRLMLRKEEGETNQERQLIMHQVNRGIVAQRLPLSDVLQYELASIMAQFTYGDLDETRDPNWLRSTIDRVKFDFLPPEKSSQDVSQITEAQLVGSWEKLAGRSSHECVRVYLNCVRRLNLGE